MAHRCTIPHWQGNTLVPAGADPDVLGVDVIPEFFETVEDPAPPKKAPAAKAKKAASTEATEE